MEQTLEALKARVEELARDLRRVEARLARLEAPPGADAREARAASADGEGAEAAAAAPAEGAPTLPLEIVPLLGRTLVVLGGAFLIRAITPTAEAASLPALGGATAGLAYGAGWLVQADRSAGRGQRLSAVFHGFAGVAIAFPLIWETTTRFGLLSTAAAASALVAFLALGLAVAWRRELPEIAWATTLFALVTVGSLLLGTRDLVPFTVALLLLAAGVELLAFGERWLALRWPIALALDVALLQMVTIAVRPGGPPESYAALALPVVLGICLALPALYLTSVAARSLLRGRPVTGFEMVQAGAALLLGFGGATKVLLFQEADVRILGILALALGAACYAAAFTAIDRASGRGRNFYCYTTYAGLLILFGGWRVLATSELAVFFSALAVAACWLGGRFDRITLRSHGAVYLAAAALAAGLLAHAGDALIGSATAAWRSMTPLCLAVAITTAGCYGILLVTARRRVFRWSDLLPQAIVAAIVVWVVAGMATRALAAQLAGAPGPEADAAFVAASRTAVVSAMAVGLAWAGRRWSLQELTWLVYAVLGAGGIRLVLEDLRYGRPVTLFLTLVLYGGALIATPRLMRGKR